MDKYLILTNPGHNRVYYESSKKLAIHELSVCLNKATDVQSIIIANVHYIGFSADLDESDIKALSELSFVYALFMEQGGLLQPIVLDKKQHIDYSINSVLKYSGKTNELFTKMMINIAAANLDYDTKKIKLCDPMAGKGTSLFTGITGGIDCYGIEIDSRSCHDAYIHCRKFLENRKIKHSTSERKISGDNKSFKALFKTVNINRGGEKIVWEICVADSALADKIYKKDFFDVMVTDLPYGVQHSSKIGNLGKKSRTPDELIKDCLPAWRKIMKPRGIIVLSWNVNVMKRESLSNSLTNNGFEILCGDLDFEHRVDQAILRDIIVARKLK